MKPDLVDVAAMVAVAAGVGGGLFPYLGWWAVAIAGVVLFAAYSALQMVGDRR